MCFNYPPAFLRCAICCLWSIPLSLQLFIDSDQSYWTLSAPNRCVTLLTSSPLKIVQLCEDRLCERVRLPCFFFVSWKANELFCLLLEKLSFLSPCSSSVIVCKYWCRNWRVCSDRGKKKLPLHWSSSDDSKTTWPSTNGEWQIDYLSTIGRHNGTQTAYV